MNSKRKEFFSHEGFDLPKTEEQVLAFWKSGAIFEKSLEKRKKGKRFIFYEGPPGANGQPGIHHVLARVFKDVIPRYKTMRGYFVPRKSGWDTHGLPVEIEAEKQLGLKSKKDIEAYGIAAFNKKCREVVWKYKADWERLTERIGFWLDLKDPYITYESGYIETLWWIIKEIDKKGLLYKGHKVVNWCTRCGTGLSSHEMAQGYSTVTDKAVTVKFQITKSQPALLRNAKLAGKFQTNSKFQILNNKPLYILAWTTTPWTLPGNVALAVGKDIKYSILESKTAIDLEITGGELHLTPGYYVIANDRLPELIKEGNYFTEKILQILGSELIGLEYEPLFNIPALQNDKSHKIYAADFVTTDEGTGVVHTAVMYGEDDYRLGTKVGLPQHHTVDEQGKFIKDVPGLGGLYVKAKETDEKIFAHLRKNGNLLKTEPYKHDYPHCWRCSTPLLYYARTSWFVAMSKLRKELIANNKKINWIPEHVKEGRFGEWLREVKDWNFTRERYWGTPFPVWECAKCGHYEAIGSLAELEEKLGGAKNEYWVMRHGESENNVKRVIDQGQGKYRLTTIGKDQVRRAAERIRKTGIDLVVSSDILRTKETAEIAASVLGVKVHYDPLLREIAHPSFAGCHDSEYLKRYPTYEARFVERPEGGESLRDLRARMWDFLRETEAKYRGKKILIVSHEYPIWMLFHAAEGWTEAQAIREKGLREKPFIKNSEVAPLHVKTVPRNDTGEIDLHRPYVDSPAFPCLKCKKGTMRRAKEVVDVWYDSGAMPFAQAHWPFAKNHVSGVRYQEEKLEYPADYISEAVDQTRGWFYTLLAVGTLLGKTAPYKNVICLGHINDKAGQKMSKSKGNVVDPWAMAEKYGMDAVRWYFYTATPPGEPKNFDEGEIAKASRKFHAMLYNSFAFYRTYGVRTKEVNSSKNILDKWVLARLSETITAVTDNLDGYAIREAGLAIEGFVDDLSRWYIRRSRRRFQLARRNLDGGGKPTDPKDYAAASWTLRFALLETAKLAAPFTPFFAEAIYGGVRNQVSGVKELQSVHLEDWPLRRAQGKQLRKNEKELIASMAEVRRIASMGLSLRAEKGIKVRQPLASLKIKDQRSKIKIEKALLEILKDEINVKKVEYDKNIVNEIELDTVITPELREEGLVREVVRAVQDLRQGANMKPRDVLVLMIAAPALLEGILHKNESVLKKEVNAKTIEYKKGKFSAEIETKIDEFPVWFGVRRV